MLLKYSAAKGIQENFQRGVRADFVKGFALVLEDFFASHVFCIQHATFCRAMHMLDQVPG